MAGAEGFPKRCELVCDEFPGKLSTSSSEMVGADAKGV